MALIYEDLTRELRRSIFDVHNELGVGHEEDAYHEALVVCFGQRGIPHLSRQRGRLMHRGIEAHIFELDLMAYDKIILELKSLATGFTQEHFVQTLNYLKFWRKQLGLLVNFGLERVAIERLPFSEKEARVEEDNDGTQGTTTPADRELLNEMQQAILSVLQMHGLGYSENVYQKLLEIEWRHRGISVANKVAAGLTFQGQPLGEFSLDALVLGNRCVGCVVALKDQIGTYETRKVEAYMKALGLPVGLVVHFGRHALQTRVVCSNG